MNNKEQQLYLHKMLFIANSFRTAIVLILITSSFFHDSSGHALISGVGFYAWVTFYLLFIAGVFFFSKEWLKNDGLTISSLIDIIMVVILMSVAGGVHSGYGILLLPFLAMASLISSGRRALFFATFATICLFIEAVIRLNKQDLTSSVDLFQTGLISLICFAVSLVTWQISQTARKASILAQERGKEISSLNRLNALALQSLSEAVIVLANDGQVAQFNLRAKYYFPAIEHGKALDNVTPLLEKWRQQPKLPLLVDQRIGKIKLNGRLVPVTDGNDSLLVLFLRDAADIAESALREKLAALGRLTANIAHEIRNPLSAINHAADLLSEQTTDKADKRLAQMICNNAKRIDRLVEEVLALNRRDRIKPEIFNLNDWMEEFLHEFYTSHPEMPRDAIILERKKNTFVRFDRGHLHQIIWNLTANAWRHSSQGPRSIILELTSDNLLFNIKVIDNGAGVSIKHQANLFEPFFTTAKSGTGLGLYIARELSIANGAHLEYIPPNGCFCLTGQKTREHKSTNEQNLTSTKKGKA